MADPLSAFAARCSTFSLPTLLKNSDLTTQVQQHLARVYVTLACALLSAAAGATFGQYVYSMGALLPSLAFIGLVAWLTATPASPATESKRAKLLAGAAFTNGLSLSPLIGMAISVNTGCAVAWFLWTKGRREEGARLHVPARLPPSKRQSLEPLSLPHITNPRPRTGCSPRRWSARRSYLPASRSPRCWPSAAPTSTCRACSPRRSAR